MVPSRASLQQILEACGIRLTSPQYDQLWAYHRLLREANEELNLTRIHNFENMVLKHYVDCLLVLKFEELPDPLVDMGSGPGLPGIPLAIARPDTQIILAETRANRTTFLQDVVDRLGLPNVAVHTGSVGPKFRIPVQGVITRAVATIPETLERVRPSLEPGGRVLFMKGPDCDDEIRAAREMADSPFRLVADHPFSIPDTPHRRRLVVYQREPDLVDQQPPDAPQSYNQSRYGRLISSATNPTFKLASEGLTGRGIRKHGHALIAGSKIVAEVLAQHAQVVEAWLTPTDGPPPPEGTTANIDWHRLDPSLFERLDVSGTRGPLLLVRVPEIPVWSAQKEWPLGCTLFIPFQDPENVGAVIRSAVAFGVSRVVLLKEAAHPFHPKASRAAGPALFSVQFETGPSIQDLQSGEIPLIALAADGAPIGECSWPERFGLVPGVEGPGLPEGGEPTKRLRIPIEPQVESLNAAAATAVALFAWRMGKR